MKIKLFLVIVCGLLILLISYNYLINFKEDNDIDETKNLIMILEYNQPYQLTSDYANQRNAEIYGDVVVWQDDRSGNWDIFMFDLSTGRETRITTDKRDQVDPRIFGDIIVWKDTRNHRGSVDNYPLGYNSDIYYYDLNSGKEQQLTTNVYCQSNPDIYQDNIVWIDYRNQKAEVFMYDLSTGWEMKISNNTNNCTNCKIFADIVIWSSISNNNVTLLKYNLTTAQTTTLDLGIETFVEDFNFDSENLVWYNWPMDDANGNTEANGNSDIHLFNFSTNQYTQITEDESCQYIPRISEGHIFWTDLRNDPDGLQCACNYSIDNQSIDNWDVYMYDLQAGQEIGVLVSEDQEILCDVFEDLLVYEKIVQGKRDIYILKFEL